MSQAGKRRRSDRSCVVGDSQKWKEVFKTEIEVEGLIYII